MKKFHSANGFGRFLIIAVVAVIDGVLFGCDTRGRNLQQIQQPLGVGADR